VRFCRTCCRQHCQALQHCQVPQLAWQPPSLFILFLWWPCPTPKRQCLHLGQAGTLVVVVWSQASYPSLKKIYCFDLVYLLDSCFVKASSFINKIQWRAAVWTVVYPTISCREKINMFHFTEFAQSNRVNGFRFYQTVWCLVISLCHRVSTNGLALTGKCCNYLFVLGQKWTEVSCWWRQRWIVRSVWIPVRTFSSHYRLWERKQLSQKKFHLMSRGGQI